MSYLADLSSVLSTGSSSTTAAQNSTNTNAGSALDMTDFLSLMVAMFQNQDIDNTASTSDMMNQMVQMSVVQAISDISTLINDSTTLTYAASLVGKEVTIGQYVGGDLQELVGTVTGTGTLNGQQVIFIGDDSYYLSDIMAIGRLPETTQSADDSESSV
ncbi:MAG: flagellar hook capping FlgD N-terminal domain-containing protein [Lawsonibacter sp.]